MIGAEDVNDDSDVPVILETDAHGQVNVQYPKNRVKGDAFHCMQAYKKTTKKRHGSKCNMVHRWIVLTNSLLTISLLFGCSC